MLISLDGLDVPCRCPAGTVTVPGGSTTCQLCIAGSSTNDLNGETQCIPCAPGSVTSKDGTPKCKVRPTIWAAQFLGAACCCRKWKAFVYLQLQHCDRYTSFEVSLSQPETFTMTRRVSLSQSGGKWVTLQLCAHTVVSTTDVFMQVTGCYTHHSVMSAVTAPHSLGFGRSPK
jgi:hypothetical protein